MRRTQRSDTPIERRADRTDWGIGMRPTFHTPRGPRRAAGLALIALALATPAFAQEACQDYDFRVGWEDDLAASSRYRVQAPDGTRTAHQAVDTSIDKALSSIAEPSDTARVAFNIVVFCAEWGLAGTVVDTVFLRPDTVFVAGDAGADTVFVADNELLLTWALLRTEILVSALPGDSIWPPLQGAQFVPDSPDDRRPVKLRAVLPPAGASVFAAYLNGVPLTSLASDPTIFPLNDVFTMPHGWNQVVINYRLTESQNMVAATANFFVNKEGLP